MISTLGRALARATLIAALSALLLPSAALAAKRPPAPKAAAGGAADVWAATWEASPEAPRGAPVSISGQTVRQIAHVSLGGIFVRIRVSNEFGDQPLTIGAAHIGLAGAGAAIQPGTDNAVTFSSRPQITIPAGARVISDPVRLTVPAMSSLAVSLYFPQYAGAVTSHFFPMQTGYMAAGDQTASPDMAGAQPLTRIVALTGVDISASRDTKVVVTLGDSYTGGFGSTMDANHRWPDLLAQRLADRGGGPPIGVVNASIGGNRLLHDFFGPNALSRFDRDVLSKPQVGYLIVLLGIDDFGLPGGRGIPEEEVTADDVIAAYRQLVARAHSYGIKVFIGTLPPFAPGPEPHYYSDLSEQKRGAVNQWMRVAFDKREFEGLIDFDAALRDPKNPIRLLPAYDSGDHLDPNDAGYQAMANAVEMRLFQ